MRLRRNPEPNVRLVANVRPLRCTPPEGIEKFNLPKQMGQAMGQAMKILNHPELAVPEPS